MQLMPQATPNGKRAIAAVNYFVEAGKIHPDSAVDMSSLVSTFTDAQFDAWKKVMTQAPKMGAAAKEHDAEATTTRFFSAEQIEAAQAQFDAAIQRGLDVEAVRRAAKLGPMRGFSSGG